MSMVSITCLKETFTIPMAITLTKMDLTNTVAITKDCTTNQVLATRQNTTRDTKRFTVLRMRVRMKKTNITLKITSPRARAKRRNMKNKNNKLQPPSPLSPPTPKQQLKKTNLQRSKNLKIKMMDKLSKRNLRQALLQRRNQHLLLSRPLMKNTIVNFKKSMINTTLSRSRERRD
jgi:hypothetical protein